MLLRVASVSNSMPIPDYRSFFVLFLIRPSGSLKYTTFNTKYARLGWIPQVYRRAFLGLFQQPTSTIPICGLSANHNSICGRCGTLAIPDTRALFFAQLLCSLCGYIRYHHQELAELIF